jgi:hypothetical protein
MKILMNPLALRELFQEKNKISCETIPFRYVHTDNLVGSKNYPSVIVF